MLIAGRSAIADIIRVNADSTNPVEDGNSWDTAFHTLPPALAAAVSGDQIWVAKGVYKPTTGLLQTVSITLKSGVGVYGGFTVLSDDFDDRDPTKFPTFLSGAIGIAQSDLDNSQHVVRATGVTNAVLEGFTIMSGYADGTGNNAHGGGLLLTNSTVDVNDCRFIDNHAKELGGAIYLEGTSNIDLLRCVFLDNDSDSSGGAVAVNAGTADVVSCRFHGNAAGPAGNGGALAAGGTTTVTISNSLVVDNEAGNIGGGVHSAGSITIRSSTIAFNAAPFGGSGVVFASGATGQMVNSIVSFNEGSTQLLNNSALSVSFSCVGTGAPPAGAGNIAADPKFRDAAGNDGEIGTDDDNFRLAGDSPCIDRGSTVAIPNDILDLDGDSNTIEQMPFDLHGKARRLEDALVANNGAGAVPLPDMGAYEHARPTTWFVNHAAVGAATGLTWTDAFPTLQQALAAQNDPKFGGPAEIWIAKGTYKPTTTTNRAISFTPSPDCRIFGGFNGGELDRLYRDPTANPVILSGAIGGASTSDNSLHVVVFDGAFIDETTVLDGVTITAGNANLPTANDSAGGGLDMRNGASPRIQNCRIIANSAKGSGGGVVSRIDSEPSFVNCVFAGNSAGADGGACFVDEATFGNCTIVGNSCSPANAAGGIGFADATPLVVIFNSILVGNTNGTGSFEAAQLSTLGSPSIQDCIIGCYSGLNPGVNVSAQPPLFVDQDGADGVPGTLDDDYRLKPGSPGIDSGTLGGLGFDLDDLDGDDLVFETFPFDADLNLRVHNDTGMPNGGATGVPIDIGAYEFSGTTTSLPNPADLNGDGLVDGSDLGDLLGVWGTNGPFGDLDFDCFVDGSDLGVLLGAWSR
ncbi:MAG: hypothetical protein FJ253_02850 [Phycisphaerae bacterium]|nr:hypothetical protein [Phycisphaerae bacterium]